MIYEIYIHVNKINKKVYIGYTGEGILQRWKAHVYKAKHHKKLNYFQLAINKYGEDNWLHQIIEYANSVEEAGKIEMKWIKHFKSNNKLFGYNSTEGGDIPKFTNEIKQKISNSLKDYFDKHFADPENKKIFIEKHKNIWKIKSNPFLGKKHTQESLKKMSDSLKEFYIKNGTDHLKRPHSEETKKRMSESAKKRTKNPNIPCNLDRVSKETRIANCKKRAGIMKSKYTKEIILELAKECRCQNDIAKKLGCTNANLSILIKKYGINEEIQNILGSNWTKERLIALIKQCKTKKEVKERMKCSSTHFYTLLKKYDLKSSIDQLLLANSSQP